MTDQKERRTVRIDIPTLGVFPDREGGNAKRIGSVLRFVTNEGARTPSGGKFTSRRVTVRFKDDPREWVGQFKSEAWEKSGRKVIILRPTGENK